MTDPLDDNEQRRKSLLDSLGPEPGPTMTVPGAGDTGGVAGPLADKPFAPMGGPMDTAAPAPAGPKSPFQSGNRSVSGYLQDAMNSFAPTIRGIGDEAGRKGALKDYLGTLTPEIQARGGNISNIRGDKADIGGRTIDFFGDVEGAATPQYLDVTDQGYDASGEMPGGFEPTIQTGGLDPQLSGNDPMKAIQEALAKYGQGNRPNMDALLAQLG